MIKILHTGDIHLDSPFSGLDPRSAEIRKNELRAAFTSMMTYAKMNNVDMLLMAGDIFDSEYVSNETLILLRRELANFGKPVFITPGNHDPAIPGSVWKKDYFSDNVHVFNKPELSSFDLDDIGTTVYGFGFSSKNMTDVPVRGRSVSDPGRINILLCHCDMITNTLDNTCCPMTADDINSFGVDYAALGHIHNPPSGSAEEKWCYCGCLEPRGFDEPGPKGACLVEISKKDGKSDVLVKRVRFSKRRYEKGEVVLQEAETQSDVIDAVSTYLTEHKFGEDAIVSIKLKGTVSPALVINTAYVSRSISGVFSIRITDETNPILDFDALDSDIGIKGEVYRQLKSKLKSEDKHERELALRALRYAFNALSGDKAF